MGVVDDVACVLVPHEVFPHLLIHCPIPHCVDPPLGDAHVLHVVYDDNRPVSDGQGRVAGEYDGAADGGRVCIDCVRARACRVHCCVPSDRLGARPGCAR